MTGWLWRRNPSLRAWQRGTIWRRLLSLGTKLLRASQPLRQSQVRVPGATLPCGRDKVGDAMSHSCKMERDSLTNLTEGLNNGVRTTEGTVVRGS